MTEIPSQGPEGQRQPTEDEIRAAYQQQLRQVHVDDVLVQTVLSLLNLGAVRAGLTEGGDADRDPAQLRSAIEGIRALMPLVEPALGQDATAIREALSQLQMAYTRQPAAGDAGEAPEPGAEPGGEGAPAAPEGAAEPQPEPGEAGPAQSSGRLWVPGQ